VITPEVEALRDQFEFPGKILQFAFGSDPGNLICPSLPAHCSYTGTHDNDTTIGWFNQLRSRKECRLRYLGCTSPAGIHWDLIRLALSSVGNQTLIPLQDVLGLGTEARMNVPSTAEGNWDYQSDALTQEVRDRLKTLTEIYGRALKQGQLGSSALDKGQVTLKTLYWQQR